MPSSEHGLRFGLSAARATFHRSQHRRAAEPAATATASDAPLRVAPTRGLSFSGCMRGGDQNARTSRDIPGSKSPTQKWRFHESQLRTAPAGTTAPPLDSVKRRVGRRARLFRSQVLYARLEELERRAAGRLEAEAERILADMDRLGAGAATSQFQRRLRHPPSKGVEPDTASGDSDADSGDGSESVGSLQSLGPLEEMQEDNAFARGSHARRVVERATFPSSGAHSSGVAVAIRPFEGAATGTDARLEPPTCSFPAAPKAHAGRLPPSGTESADSRLRRTSSAGFMSLGRPKTESHASGKEGSPGMLSRSASMRVMASRVQSMTSALSAMRPQSQNAVHSSRVGSAGPPLTRKHSMVDSLVRYASPDGDETAAPDKAARKLSFRPRSFLQSMGLNAQLSSSKKERKQIMSAIDAKSGQDSNSAIEVLRRNGVAAAPQSGDQAGERQHELRVEWQAMEGSRLELMLPPCAPERHGVVAPRSAPSRSGGSADAPVKDVSTRRPGGVADRLGAIVQPLKADDMPAGRFLLPSTQFAADAGLNTLRVMDLPPDTRDRWLGEAFKLSTASLREKSLRARRTERPIRLGPVEEKARPPTRVRFGNWAVPVSKWKADDGSRTAATAPAAAGPSATPDGPVLPRGDEAAALASQLETMDAPFLFRAFCQRNATRLRQQVDDAIDAKWEREAKAGWNLASLRRSKDAMVRQKTHGGDPSVPIMLHGLPAAKRKDAGSRSQRFERRAAIAFGSYVGSSSLRPKA